MHKENQRQTLSQPATFLEHQRQQIEEGSASAPPRFSTIFYPIKPEDPKNTK